MHRTRVKKMKNKIKFKSNFMRVMTLPMVVAIITYALMTGSAAATEDKAATIAFPDKYMIRLGAYIVDGSETTFNVNSNVLGLGTTIDYARDLGGDTREIIPRIDAYYRFNPRHRINFTAFSIDRPGQRELNIDPPVVIGGEDFSGGTINSNIKYTLFKLGYGYSFYHNDKVELSVTAGLNFTDYELSFSNDTDKLESAGVSAPLPMFGYDMGYAITPKWSTHFLVEAFFISIDDTFEGSLMHGELNTEYRLFKNFAIGAGFVRFSTSVDIDDSEWSGKVHDTSHGFNAFGTFYF
jgi:hypothetical protein